MVAIPSPTGEERQLAEHLAGALGGAGLRARYQPIDERQGNAVGRLDGSGDGPELLLYAPIDTLTTGDADGGLPMGGSRAPGRHAGRGVERRIVGRRSGRLEPQGPRRLRHRRRGSHRAGGRAAARLGDRRPRRRWHADQPARRSASMQRHNAGQGNGCSFMLEQGTYPDFAIIAKPGWTVDWEEVGLCWFRVRVHGRFSYVGSRHRIAFKNPIVDAAAVIQALEAWFPKYAVRNTSGLVAPQANIGHIEGGWARTASAVAGRVRARRRRAREPPYESGGRPPAVRRSGRRHPPPEPGARR